MSCNRIIKPEFTEEQIAECHKCKHISAKKRWCGLFGCWVKEKSLIIQPNRKVLHRKLPTISQMAAHFAKAMIKWAGSGFKVVDKETYFKRRLICAQCQPTGRCPHCGCNLWAKAALATEKCPEGKW